MLRRISMTPEDIIRGLRDVLPGADASVAKAANPCHPIRWGKSSRSYCRRLVRRIDDRAAGSRFHTREHIVPHERLAIDEADPVGATVELPQIAVARRVDEAFDNSVATPVINQDRRQYFVPIPRVVLMMRKVALDRAVTNVERHDRFQR